MHGIAGWFDLLFAPRSSINSTTVSMSTSPSSPNTHWQQIRFLFQEPLAVNVGDRIKGWMRCKVNSMRSYNVIAEVLLNDAKISTPDAKEATDILTSCTPGESRWLTNSEGRRRNFWFLHEQVRCDRCYIALFHYPLLKIT
jgi:histone-arginine methyltransferase CARM1